MAYKRPIIQNPVMLINLLSAQQIFKWRNTKLIQTVYTSFTRGKRIEYQLRQSTCHLDSLLNLSVENLE